MNIINKVLAIRNSLSQINENEIDLDLAPIPPFIGKERIRIIVIGQDPTIRNKKQREKIAYTLNLDKEGSLRKYIEKICNGIGLSLDNVYATNIFKYFYNTPPASTPNVLYSHKEPNIKLLKEELAIYGDCPVITLGEPVLQLLSGQKEKVRAYWNYNNCGWHCVSPTENCLGRRIYPFPHQPSMRKVFYNVNFEKYIAFMKEKERQG